MYNGSGKGGIGWIKEFLRKYAVVGEEEVLSYLRDGPRTKVLY
jgi:hypothetical protein